MIDFAFDLIETAADPVFEIVDPGEIIEPPEPAAVARPKPIILDEPTAEIAPDTGPDWLGTWAHDDAFDFRAPEKTLQTSRGTTSLTLLHNLQSNAAEDPAESQITYRLAFEEIEVTYDDGGSRSTTAKDSWLDDID